ncbi:MULTISPECIES: Ohr family peroxiredoxin [Spirosoma]|jgi:Ohr subfamily peroxiredoxin|uniref:Ohr family peroxiredoxin n=1 Tax=Spirosoma sordidisoli TaxID=2502893 RepID=A0A4Q2UKG4_9BACT|nr:MULTISPECIES: Ohr family peroxiredoxin [Spirosoma]RYC69132.1 Ohr family peroxiredoxin [Spirosoma sordidisoli]
MTTQEPQSKVETLYTATVSNVGGREGDVKSLDGVLELDVRRPIEMHGEGKAANPEMLFAAAYSSCYNGALMAVAERRKVILPQHAVEVSISLNKDGNNMFLSGKIVVKAPGMDKEQLQQLAETAHAVCPYSKAVKGNMDMAIEVMI